MQDPQQFQNPHAQERYAEMAESARVETALAGVFMWMAVGLGITGVIAFAVAFIPPLTEIIFGVPFLFYGLLAAEFALVWFLVLALPKMNAMVATGAFLAYAALNGLTLSVIFLVYELGSIGVVFFVCAGMFGAVSLYGLVTKKDLSGWGTFLFMGLIGLILMSIMNLIIGSSMIYWGISVFGVLLFVGLTAYDTNKIKRMAMEGGYDKQKLAIFGALILYLDFINLFLMLLRLFAKRR